MRTQHNNAIIDWPRKSLSEFSLPFFTSHPLAKMSRFFQLRTSRVVLFFVLIFLSLLFPLGLHMGGVPSSHMHRVPPNRTCSTRSHSNVPRRRDKPSARVRDARAQELFLLFFHLPRTAEGWVLYCTHCPSTFPSYADSEHEYPPFRCSLPPHCQPVTSYPFSCKHRLTKFV